MPRLGIRTILLVALKLLLFAGRPLAGVPIPWHPRWANPLPHGNNVFAIAHDPSRGRAVTVSERGLLHYSDDLVTWIPRETGLEAALRGALFTPSGRLVLVGEAGTVLYSDGIEQLDPVTPGQLLDGPTEDWLEGVAMSPALIVAVGDLGAIYLSPDGAIWRRQATPYADYLSGVAWGTAGFVAVGDAGAILSSPDGTNWTRGVVGSGDWLGVTARGGDYLAVGRAGAIASRSGGGAWVLESTGHTNDLWVGTLSGSTRLVGGTSELLLSEKGAPWVDQLGRATAPAPPGTYYASLPLTNYFLLAGRGGLLTEGRRGSETLPFAWAEIAPSIRPFLSEVAFQNGLFATIGQNGAILTSGDGVDWSLELVPRSVTNTTLLGIGGDSNLLVAVGTRGALLRSPNWVTNILTPVDTGAGTILTSLPASTYGTLWLDLDPRPTTNQLHGVASGRGLYVVTGDNGEVLTSTEGSLWTHRPSPTTNLLSGVTAWGSGFAACGQGGTLLTSLNGIVWRRGSLRSSAWLFRIRAHAGLLAMVGEAGTMLTSLDGETWTAHATGSLEFLTDVAWIGTLCVVVGESGTVLGSEDYTNWTVLNPFTYRDLYGISASGNRLVMVGQEGVILRNSTPPCCDPVALLEFGQTLNLLDGTAENLFLLGGETDQRFVIDSCGDPASGAWVSGPYLEFLDSGGTITYLQSLPVGKIPTRQYYRTRLIP